MSGLTVLVLLSFLGQAAFPDLPVPNVEFTGNRHLSEEKLVQAFHLEAGCFGEPESVFTALERVLALYRDLGYLFAKAEVVEEPDELARLLVRVEEGQRYTVGHIGMEGNESISDNMILSQMDTRAGGIFVQKMFLKDMEHILRLYEDNGFAFVQVVPQGFSYDTVDHKIGVILRIMEGPKVRLAGVKVKGSTISKPQYLARESGIRKGQIFSALELENAKRRLERLPFLARVGDFRLEPASSQEMVWAIVEVEEGAMNIVYGVLGYEPGEEGGLTGLLTISLENLTGRGRGLKARWQRTNPLTSWLDLAYREPFVFSYDVGFEVSFSHQIRDTSFTKSSLSVVGETRSGTVLGFSLGLSLDRVLPGSFPVPSSKSYGVRTGIWVDTRDSPRLPRRGIFYTVHAQYALRVNSPTQLVREPEPRANTGRLTFDFVHHVPSFGEQSFYAAVHGREAYSSEPEVPFHDYFFLGGASSVRGYREEQFAGSRVAWANMEYRFQLGRDSYLYPFLDIGYYESKGTGSVLGYGIGLALRKGLAGIGLDYGLAKEDKPLDGKIHLRLTGQF